MMQELTAGTGLTDAEFLAVSARAREHYAETLARHGPTPRGVDWEDLRLQQIRFGPLLKLVDAARPFSLNDSGCGYGALLDYLKSRLPLASIDYLGIDVAESMVREARNMWRAVPEARFAVGATSPRQADYSVASGIFNVRLEHPVALWERYVARILDNLHDTSRIGFAVNFRAQPHSGFLSAGLYETSPDNWAQFCRQRYGAAVQVIADYGLREFTLLVRRNASVDEI